MFNGESSRGGAARNFLAAIDPTPGAATSCNPNPNHYTVRALALSGSTVYAGGDFSSIGAERRRRNIAALDPATGIVTSWNPNAVGYVVEALTVSGSTVDGRGRLSSIGGPARRSSGGLAA